MIVWAIETLIATTLLMLLVLAIRTPVRRSFGPGIAYALWAIPALRMLLPPLPASWHAGVAAPLSQAGQTLVHYIAEPGVGPSATAPTLWPWLSAGWAIGAAGFIGYHLISHGRFVARVRSMAQSVRTVASGRVEVIETDAAAGPLAFGVWRKYVAFPRDFAERYDPLERDLALAHELGHHARGDLLANWAALAVLALHWFNPVAWRAFRAFRADQEMACDALVLAGRAGALRHAYGRAIVKSAHGGAVSAACHLHSVNEIKGRLKMLGVHDKSSRSRIVAGAGALVALTLGGLGVTASGTQAAERVRTSVESAVGVDLASLEMPTLAQDDTAPSPSRVTAANPARHVRVILHKEARVRELSGEDVDLDGAATEHVERRTHHYAIARQDGEVTSWDRPAVPPEALAAMKRMPTVTSRGCSAGEGHAGETVIHEADGDARRIIICTDRIAAMSARASALARTAADAHVRSFRIERYANASALDGLRRARVGLANNEALADLQRSSALSGIDRAIRQMESRTTD